MWVTSFQVRKKKNMVYPGITIFAEPGKDKSSRKPSNEDSACHEDRRFWYNGDQTKVLETRSLASPHQGKNLLKYTISSQCEADALRASDRSYKASSACCQLNKCGVSASDEEFRSSFGE